MHMIFNSVSLYKSLSNRDVVIIVEMKALPKVIIDDTKKRHESTHIYNQFLKRREVLSSSGHD